LIRPCLLTSLMQGAFVPTVCQQIALTALRQKDESFEWIRAEIESRRRYAYERLQAVGLGPAWPARGLFLWVPGAGLGLSGRTFAEELRQAKRVLVTPGSVYGPSGAGFVRLSYATEDGRLREGLSRIAEFVRELNGAPAEELAQAA